MSALALDAAAARPARGISGAAIGNAIVAVIVFLGGFVIVEPAPYELLLAATIVVWAIVGLRFNRHTLPLTVLLFAWVAGGWLSFTQLSDFSKPIVYMGTSTLLAASAIFFAAVILERPDERLRIVRNAYVASALIAAAIGVLAYFEVLPHSDLFKRYDRAMGPFQDPNVFAPFLVLPLCFLANDILTRPLRRSFFAVGTFLVILFAIFLAFSRAGWGLAVIALLITAYLAFATAPRQLTRFRLVAYLVGGGAALAIMLAVAISIPAVRDLYVQRAHVVQDYDEGHLGRFARWQIGADLIQARPLGLGPFQLGKLLGEDEHNMWLKGFTVYGWLGGVAYIVLALWTLAAAAPLLFKPRAYTPIVQATYAVLLGHVLLMHNVIDNDHWRHLFLLYGVLWGAIGAEKMRLRRTVAPPAAAVARSFGPLSADGGAIERARPAN